MRAARAPARGEAHECGVVVGLTHEGEGVVHAGKTVFVTGALPGEAVRFRRTRRRRQHDEGQLLEVLEASPQRIPARCAHFGLCGGCALQHLTPAAQLTAKESELRESLARLAQVSPGRWLAPLAGPHFGYRRRARLGARYVHKKGCVVVGFRERAAPYVAQLRGCEVLAPQAAALIEPLAQLIGSLSIREQLPQIEVAVAENATALVLRVLRPPQEEDRARLRHFAATHGVRLWLQSGGPHALEALQPEGEPLYYTLPQFSLTLQFAPTDFIQINAAVNAELVGQAVELLELRADAQVLDLFCGIGNFTLALARRAANVVGVEGEATLLERARGNARRNALPNAQFHRADLSLAPPADAPWLRGPYTHVLLDPPRTGARALLPALAGLAVERVLYISCHPGSLARDVGELVHVHGMRLEAAGIVDMFPHTAHVESVALLAR